MEGFIGGMVCNIIGTFFWVGAMNFETGFMFCGPKKYDWNWCENWQCDEIDPIYVKQKYTLPFSILGTDSMMIN